MKKKVFTLKGRSKLGLESTVIQVKNKTINILRLGSITEEEIKKKFKTIKIKKIPYTKLSPGNQKKHYSPNLPIRINVKKVKNDEVLLNFGKNIKFRESWKIGVYKGEEESFYNYHTDDARETKYRCISMV